MKLNKLILAMGCLALAACSNDNDPQVEVVKETVKTAPLTITVSRDDVATTRMEYTQEDDGSLSVKWNAGDALSVVFKNGTEVVNEKFEIVESSISADGQTAKFTCNNSQWANRKAVTEVLVGYPFSDQLDTQGYPRVLLGNQDGTLENLSKHTILVGRQNNVAVDADFPKVELKNSTFVLRLPKGLKLLNGLGGTIDNIQLGLTGTNLGNGFVYELGAVNIQPGPISVVGPKLTDGALADDVYFVIAEPAEIQDWIQGEIKLMLYSGYLDESYYYTLNKAKNDFKNGVCYKLTTPVTPLDVNPIIGMVIGSDGKYYANKATADAVEGVKAEAMIAYLGTKAEDAAHGLAIALEDVEWEGPNGYDYNTTGIMMKSWRYDHTINGSIGGWRLPSADDWKYMFQGCGGTPFKEDLFYDMEFNYGNFRTKIKDAGGKDVKDGVYWSSTKGYEELQEEYHPYGYDFPNGKFRWYDDNGLFNIRACYAF